MPKTVMLTEEEANYLLSIMAEFPFKYQNLIMLVKNFLDKKFNEAPQEQPSEDAKVD